ncbi:MAG: hypothetical protein IT370_11760 [Deltaproteobacteria bacterium]|nr:hypothetical protein [Deltaproteobacteria bacterium]
MPEGAPLEIPAEVRAVITHAPAPGSRAHGTDGDGPRCFRLTRSIDTGGVTLRRALPLPPGERVRVTIALPAADPDVALEPFAVTGIVTDTRQASETSERDASARTTRIEFTALDDEVRARITAYVQERLGLPA